MRPLLPIVSLFPLFFIPCTTAAAVVATPVTSTTSSPSTSHSKCHHNGLVHLGYAKHVPTSVNHTSTGRKVSIYRNIRFANPPTGDLRFRLPDTNLPHVPGIQDGDLPLGSTDCISSAPAEAPFPGINGTTWGREDCLFLDVYVPESVKPGDKVPVLQLFFGSAYAFGSKEMFTTPMGLFDVEDAGGGMGVSGWVSAPDLDMVANVGMHDCLAAAKWTSKFIDRFGGDPDRVTVLGNSAGSGIIQLATVMDGGKSKLPFQQAFVSSPAIQPRRNVQEGRQKVFEQVLNAANCTSLDCLRDASEDTMREVNDILINQTPSDAGGGQFGPNPGIGPFPDGHVIADAPEALYREGRFNNKDLRSLVIGNMAYEGMGLTRVEGFPDYFAVMVRQIFPDASDEDIETFQNGYEFAENPAKLAWDWMTDIIFACNAYNLARAYEGKASRYIMSTPPATHGWDFWHFFHVDQETTPVENPALAKDLQRRLLRFVQGEKDTGWPGYGPKETILNITDSAFEKKALPEDLKARCDRINSMLLLEQPRTKTKTLEAESGSSTRVQMSMY